MEDQLLNYVDVLSVAQKLLVVELKMEFVMLVILIGGLVWFQLLLLVIGRLLELL
jgi:hypothetical protein